MDSNCNFNEMVLIGRVTVENSKQNDSFALSINFTYVEELTSMKVNCRARSLKDVQTL